MKVQLIIDFMHLFYKYKYTLNNKWSGIQRLYSKSENGVRGRDISNIFYPLRDIENFRKQFEKEGHEVVVSVCFDSRSKRKDRDTNYKANRTKSLTDEELLQIGEIRGLLNTAGHNTYKMEGYEADDIVANLLKYYKDSFDFNVIYTNDTDLLIHIDSKVGVNRYKVRKGYTPVALANRTEYIASELKCNIPRNGLLMHKVLCGDKSDGVIGVRGMGKVKFERFIEFLGDSMDWDKGNDIEYVGKVLLENMEYFQKNKLDASGLENSISMIGYEPMEKEDLPEPIGGSTESRRAEGYLPLGMKSLI